MIKTVAWMNNMTEELSLTLQDERLWTPLTKINMLEKVAHALGQDGEYALEGFIRTFTNED